MSRRSLILMTLFVGSLALPAAAQQTTQTLRVDAFGPQAEAKAPQATPDAMVARLMSFDRNHDGLVARDELPERMQPLLARIEVFTTGGGLDEKEIRRLAENPVATPQRFVVQEGHYGFGDDNGFDTRLHIESAIEDLRLAGATRDKALEIGRQFSDESKAQARAALIATVTPLLTDEQLTQVVAALDLKANFTLRADSDIEARLAMMKSLVQQMERQMQRRQLTAAIAAFSLEPEQNRQATAAVEQFIARDRLSDADRTALLDRMGNLLSVQERDDLRAALERRPIIKQGALVTARVQAVSF